jgi:cytochrome c oxidase subunit 4
MQEHIDSVKTYVLVFIGLIFLTVATTAVAFVDLGPFSIVVALAIAVCKMLLVALFFMHLRHSTILLVLTMTDFVTRGNMGVPGR